MAKRLAGRSGADDAGREKIFSKTTRKLPVQLNRKQYENLFESFDYTKEATVDVGRRASRERKREREGEREGGRGKKSGHIRERRRIFLVALGNNGPPSDLQSGSPFLLSN